LSDPTVLAKLYRSGGGYAAALWNTAAAPAKAYVAIDSAKAGVKEREGAAPSLRSGWRACASR